jgi:uncharacterized protein YdeI (YjbR/CyaY-like superfamily)
VNRLEVITRKDWREWLEENHTSVPEVWIVFYKKHTGLPSLSYDDAVEEALCFGWIDSIIKRLDDGRYVRKFTPRKPGSNWSEINKTRARKMMDAGRMTDAGLKAIEEAKKSREWNRKHEPSRLPPEEIPQELEEAFSKHPRAREGFESLAPSYRRKYVMWIASAKRPETRQRRTDEAIGKLKRGEKLGLR